MRIRWHIVTVEVAGHSTRSSLAFSPSGRPAIAYHSSFNNALRFATLNDDGTWAISTVDTVSSDCKPSLAFRFRQPAISYSDSANYTIKYAVGTIFRTPIDDLISFLGGLLFRMSSAMRRVPKPSLP